LGGDVQQYALGMIGQGTSAPFVIQPHSD